jgi:hypothetical protein
VLLIDEIDRAGDEFEAFLLEVLSTYQVSIPEFGTVNADTPPIVVLTSNRTRDLHDASTTGSTTAAGPSAGGRASCGALVRARRITGPATSAKRMIRQNPTVSPETVELPSTWIRSWTSPAPGSAGQRSSARPCGGGMTGRRRTR